VNVSSWYFLPLYFQAVKESTPLHSGLLVLPVTLVQSVVSVAAGTFIHQTGRYLELIWIGMTFTCLGFGLFIKLRVNSSLFEVSLLEIIAGLGVGLVFQPPMIALQSLVEHDEVAAATALFGFVRSLSTAISIVIGGVIFQNQMQTHFAEILAVLPVNIAQKFSGGSAAANVKLIGSLKPTQELVVKEAYAKSLSSMWILYASAATFGLVVSTLISRQKLSTEHVETITGIEKRDQNGNNTLDIGLQEA
jgi:hypothetical protein